MSYQVSWLIENRVILVKQSGVSSGEVMREIMQAIQQKLDDSLDSPIHILYDISEVVEIVTSNQPVATIRKSSAMTDFYKQSRLGWVIYTGPVTNPFYRFMMAVTSQVHDVRMRWTESRQQAFDFLESIDSTLKLNTQNTEADGEKPLD